MSKQPQAISRKLVVAELCSIAENAEAAGDRKAAVRALKYARRIERQRRQPTMPSIDRIIETAETIRPLIRRFAPADACELETMIAKLRRCRLELAQAERLIFTLH